MCVPNYGCHYLASPLLSFSLLWTLFGCCFWLGMSKRGTHIEKNLRIPKDLCKIVNALPSNIFEVSAISRNFNSQLPKTILWTFVMFSGTTANFGQPERSESSLLVRARLNSAYQSMILDFLREE